MRPFRLLMPALALVAACGTHANTPPAHTAMSPPAPSVKPIASEDEYDAARAEFDAVAPGSSGRAERRAALETWLLQQVREQLDRGHPEDAYEQFRQAVTLWDPEELAQKPHDPALQAVSEKVEAAFKKRGAHEEVLLALCVQMSLDDGARGPARRRFDEVIGWLRAGGATDSELGGAVDGRGRVVDDMETGARLWPSPFVVDQLTAMYLERQNEGGGVELGGGRPRRGADLRALLQGGSAPSAAYDLARLYLRVSRPDEAVVQVHKVKASRPGDEQVQKLIEKYADKKATPGDALNVAMLLAQGHEDADVAERVCADSSLRFPQAAEPHLCAGQIAMARDRLVVAMRHFEAARALQPSNREIWQQLARLYERRLFQLVSSENLNVAELEPQLKKVEEFHAAANKQFPGEPLHPSLAGALFEVGRGYYNAGRLDKAMEYLEKSVGTEPMATTLELMGQIRQKKGEAKEAVALYERAIGTPKGDRAEEIYWRARIRRELGDAFDLVGDAQAAETTRKAALADWDLLARIGLTADGKAEAGIERAKLYYALGERDLALGSFEQAIDAAPDRGGTYADVIAFLVPRGELDEALDAYHRALGRNEVTEYLKVYCSLWIVDLGKRAGQPVDPLASSYLASTDGGKWYDDLARWASGRENETQLLARVDTPAKKAEAAFYRGMRLWGEGKLEDARKLWKDVLDTDMMAFFEYDMAQMYLRMGAPPAKPILKSKPGTVKVPPTTSVRPPDGSI
jgi:tetratricopeptide (TPR) repeat protein